MPVYHKLEYKLTERLSVNIQFKCLLIKYLCALVSTVGGGRSIVAAEMHEHCVQ